MCGCEIDTRDAATAKIPVNYIHNQRHVVNKQLDISEDGDQSLL